MTKVALITGAGGFIGGHLVGHLKTRGYTKIRAVDIKPLDAWYQLDSEVENLTLDLREKAACEEAVQGCAHVYNLAADMGGIGFIEHNKALCMLSVLINTHLLMAATQFDVERYLYTSSACVYNGDKQNTAWSGALREEDAYPAMPEDGYGWEKLYGERMCRHFQEDFGLVTRVARLHNVYGPYGTYEGGREKAPAAICRKVIEAIQQENPQIRIWGDGTQTRSFMYIDDCLRGLCDLMNHPHLEIPLNLGTHEQVTINQLVDYVEDIAGVSLERHYELNAPRGVQGRNSDNTRFQAYMGWEPSIPLRKGLEPTYTWIREQMEHGCVGNREKYRV